MCVCCRLGCSKLGVRAAWRGVLGVLRDERVAVEIEAAFARGKGLLSLDDLVAALRLRGALRGAQEAALVKAELAALGDGAVSLDEFLEAVQRNRDLARPETLAF